MERGSDIGFYMGRGDDSQMCIVIEILIGFTVMDNASRRAVAFPEAADVKMRRLWGVSTP